MPENDGSLSQGTGEIPDGQMAERCRRIARGCGIGAMLIGIAGLLGWMFNISVLKSIIPGYQPIVISGSIIFIMLGGVQFLEMRASLSRGAILVLLGLSLFCIVFGVLEIIYLLTGVNLTIEDAILRHYPALFKNQFAHISPVSGILIFLLGLAQTLYLYQRVRGEPGRISTRLVGLLGSLVILISAVFFLSYLYGTPLFYHTRIIPIAWPSTIAALLLGSGLVAIACETALPLRWFAGSSTRARLLRAFLPLTALLLLLFSITQFFLTRLRWLNPAITAAILIIFFEILIGIIVLQVARIMGNLIDLTEHERQHAVEELRLLSTALESAANGVALTDRQGSIIWVNPAFTRLTGYTLEEAKGQNPRILNSGQQPRIFFETLWETILRGEPWHGQLVNRRKDGSLYTEEMTITPVRAGGGEITHFVAIKEDISERKRAEEERIHLAEEIAAQRRLFQMVVENAPAGIAILSGAEHRYIVANAAYAPFVAGKGEIIGRTVAEVFPEIAETIIPLLDRVYRSGETYNATDLPLTLRRAGQFAETYITFSYTPWRDEHGHIQGVLVLVLETTERRRAEIALRQLNETLEQRVHERTAALEAANKELEAFSYSVSHDLRAPLRGIDGFSKMLQEKYREQLDAQGQDYLTRVRNAAQRMGRIIDDMLKLSRIGRREMRREPIDLSAIAAALIEELRNRDPERHVEVEIMPHLQVSGDAGLLRIVLDNLLGNAWKFTSHREDARITFTMTRKDGERVFYVRDNGAGFDMSYADKLFTPFQRLHTEEEFPGTGIGLAIVQRIIVRHGGRVWAEGEEGKGATIYFTLGEEAAND